MDELSDIKTIEVHAPDFKEAGGMDVEPCLLVTWQNGNKNYLPNDPSNRHYQLAKLWYDQQSKKPFEFVFAE